VLGVAVPRLAAGPVSGSHAGGQRAPAPPARASPPRPHGAAGSPVRSWLPGLRLRGWFRREVSDPLAGGGGAGPSGGRSSGVRQVCGVESRRQEAQEILFLPFDMSWLMRSVI